MREEEGHGTVIDTPQYIAPEIVIIDGYDEKVDIWALGISLFKIVTGQTSFESLYVSDTIANIRKIRPLSLKFGRTTTF